MERYYRCYLLNGELKIASAYGLECADDEEAVRKAAELLAETSIYHGIEVWYGARRVHVQIVPSDPGGPKQSG